MWGLAKVKLQRLYSIRSQIAALQYQCLKQPGPCVSTWISSESSPRSALHLISFQRRLGGCDLQQHRTSSLCALYKEKMSGTDICKWRIGGWWWGMEGPGAGRRKEKAATGGGEERKEMHLMIGSLWGEESMHNHHQYSENLLREMLHNLL